MAGLPRRVRPLRHTILMMLALTATVLTALWGCAHKEATPLGIVPTERVFSTEAIYIKARPLGTEESTGIALFDELKDRGFIVIKTDIHNRSTSTVIYNVANTFIFVPPMDYKKPLDLSDIYFMVRRGSDDAAATMALSRLEKRLFSSSVRIKANGSAQGYLIFRPLSEPSKGSPVTLGINQLYVGTTAIDIRLRFRTE